MFIDIEAVPPIEVFPGVRMRTPFGKNLMLSYVEIDEGALVTTHHHPHEQGGVVLTGRLSLTIGEQTRTLEPGEMYIIPPDTPHRASAVGGRCIVMDVFSPVREDYVALMNAARG